MDDYVLEVKEEEGSFSLESLKFSSKNEGGAKRTARKEAKKVFQERKINAGIAVLNKWIVRNGTDWLVPIARWKMAKAVFMKKIK